MEKNLKDLYFVSVYYSFDCDSPLYVFSTEEEAVAFIRKQYQDELNIECRELEIDMSVSEKDYSDYPQPDIVLLFLHSDSLPLPSHQK